MGTAGDVNGDGWADILVGVPGLHGDELGEGSALAYYGSAKGPAQIASWTGEGNQEGANFGVAVGTAGDVNGDGFDDVIVGATSFDIGGAAFVFHGSASGLSETRDWMAVTDQDIAFFGRPVGTAGDVNGDGYDEMIVGALFFAHPDPAEGIALVFRGRGGRPTLTWADPR